MPVYFFLFLVIAQFHIHIIFRVYLWYSIFFEMSLLYSFLVVHLFFSPNKFSSCSWWSLECLSAFFCLLIHVCLSFLHITPTFFILLCHLCFLWICMLLKCRFLWRSGFAQGVDGSYSWQHQVIGFVQSRSYTFWENLFSLVCLFWLFFLPIYVISFPLLVFFFPHQLFIKHHRFLRHLQQNNPDTGK